jgi:hypothetical protein
MEDSAPVLIPKLEFTMPNSSTIGRYLIQREVTAGPLFF